MEIKTKIYLSADSKVRTLSLSLSQIYYFILSPSDAERESIVPTKLHSFIESQFPCESYIEQANNTFAVMKLVLILRKLIL